MAEEYVVSVSTLGEVSRMVKRSRARRNVDGRYKEIERKKRRGMDGLG
jgi:hypothetical protein